MEHKQYVKGAALEIVRYSGRLPTAGTAVFYGVSKQHKYHTIYILQLSLCNNVPQVPPQHHFHTQDCISQTVWSDVRFAHVLMHWDICIYTGYQYFIFWYWWKRDWGSRLSLYYNVPQIRNLNGAQCGAVGWGTAFQANMSPVQIPVGLLEIFIDIFFPAALWPQGRRNLNTNECQGCLLRDKGDCA